MFSSTWTCKGGDEERFFMALLPQTGKGKTMKGNLWIRKLEITTFPSVPESNNGQPWLKFELSVASAILNCTLFCCKTGINTNNFSAAGIFCFEHCY